MEKRVLLNLILLLSGSTSGLAATRLVPSEYPTIQAAIDACADGDTVIVAPSTYTGDGNRDIDFRGKAISVRSTEPYDPNIVAATCIDCNGTKAEPHRGFHFQNSEDANSVLAGLTITNGYAPKDGSIFGSTRSVGGGIFCHNASPTIRRCIITGNFACRDGGGICCHNSAASVISCTISYNSTKGDGTTFGGGIHSWQSGLTISNCTITGNLARGMPGGGVWCGGSTGEITNCIVWGNRGQYDHAIHLDGRTSVVVTHSDVEAGWEGEGNTDLDPCFVQVGYWDPNGTASYPWDDFWVEGDYHLLPNSPCINAGDPDFVPEVNETDIDGQPRVAGGRVDMGADEFVIEVPMTFTPKAFNPCSQGKWVKAHLALPEEFALDDVDSNTPATLRLLGTQIESEQMNVFVNEEGAVEVEAAFDRAAFCNVAHNFASGFLNIGVEGLLTSDRAFYGTDTIKMISQDFRCLGDFVSHWLRTDCQRPDWCAGFDLNRDSVANFVDLATLQDHSLRPLTWSQ